MLICMVATQDSEMSLLEFYSCSFLEACSENSFDLTFKSPQNNKAAFNLPKKPAASLKVPQEISTLGVIVEPLECRKYS